MSVVDTIARPYAKAIFEIALQNNNIQEWKNTLIFINKITASKKIKNFLSGALSPKYLSLIFITISDGIIDKNAKNLIKLLAENQRFKILNKILIQFLQLESDYQNTLTVQLISAHFLEDHDIIKIQKILEKYFLKKIKLTCKVDPQILGGIMIKINDTIFDFSIQNYLKQLSAALNF